MNALRKYFDKIAARATRRETSVSVVTMGATRVFEAFDIGADTFILEKGALRKTTLGLSVLIVAKHDLGRAARGFVLSVSSGNHSVAAFPLLDGRFWSLARVPREKRSHVLLNAILCANIVGGTLEISQRGVSTERLLAADAWLRARGVPEDQIVFADRNRETLAALRVRGLLWRVKPLAWSEKGMKCALAASVKRISTRLSYYHSVLGVHFLTLPEFRRFAESARTDPEEFRRMLRELVAVDAGNEVSLTRQPKVRGHHEIEFFGIRRGLALERLVPKLEALAEAIELRKIGQLGIIQSACEAAHLFEQLLTQPELGNETSPVFTETLYMYVTGEVYLVVGEGSARAFDDRRRALPGATFVNGKPVLHASADARTEALLDNLGAMLSKGEFVEYANVYELGGASDAPIGRGATREVDYKTNLRPLECSFIEKRLSHASAGYSDYVLARIGALRALGIGLSDYYRLLRRTNRRAAGEFYIRTRCAGYSLETIPATYFHADGKGGEDDRRVVTALVARLGDAAAQNLAMKKCDARGTSALFGVGKEIFEFAFDIFAGRMMPKSVRVCSIRGALGWPETACDETNLSTLENFYMRAYAAVFAAFAARHGGNAEELTTAFFEGFDLRLRTLAGRAGEMQNEFRAFNPALPARFGFRARWGFALWSLARHVERLDVLHACFRAALANRA